MAEWNRLTRAAHPLTHSILIGRAGELAFARSQCNVKRVQKSETDMTKTAQVSVRLNAALNDRVAAIAAVLGQPESWVIEQAVQDFVVLQEWQLTAIDEGLREADAGRVVPHESVVAWVKSWGRPDELSMPECE
jgi:predicted transcriptional regulator